MFLYGSLLIINILLFFTSQTNVRKTLEKSGRYGETLEIMYMAKDRSISKRKVKVLHMHKETFVA
ncbi:hypothetical protein CSV79_01475 [Sporosarcina sp. P13]|nr:hypothetical protein CSV79_01475 [Sporosarcina sp. P13]